jgi:hypothetical protein
LNFCFALKSKTRIDLDVRQTHEKISPYSHATRRKVELAIELVGVRWPLVLITNYKSGADCRIRDSMIIQAFVGRCRLDLYAFCVSVLDML